MEMLRRQFGIAEPIRRGMEVKIATAGEWRPAVLGGASGVHKDILQGRDTEIGWEDVFTGKPSKPLRRTQYSRMSRIGGCSNRNTNIMECRQRAPRSARLPHRDGDEDEDELVRER